MQSLLPLASLGQFNVNNLIFLGEFGMDTVGIFIKPKYPYRKYFCVLFKLQGLNFNGICYFCLILFQIWMKCHWS